MKTNIRKTHTITHRTTAVIIVILLVIVVMGILWYLGSKRDQPANTISTKSQVKTDLTTTNSVSNTASNTSNSDDTANNTKSNASSTSGSPSSTTTVTITSVNQTQVNTISVSAYASTVAANGTCTFTFTQGRVSFYRNTNILQNPSTSSCETLTLHNSDFPSLGAWQLVVGFTSGSISGTSSPTTVVLK